MNRNSSQTICGPTTSSYFILDLFHFIFFFFILIHVGNVTTPNTIIYSLYLYCWFINLVFITLFTNRVWKMDCILSCQISAFFVFRNSCLCTKRNRIRIEQYFISFKWSYHTLQNAMHDQDIAIKSYKRVHLRRNSRYFKVFLL